MNNEQLLSFLQALVRQRSLSGEEADVIRLITSEMAALNFDRIQIDDWGNAIGVIEGIRPGPTILLDAHCDTVGIAPGSTWSVDPFGGSISDGMIYGRGTADMKGALAAMVYAAARIDRQHIAGRIVISASVMEEVLEGVALEHVLKDYPADFVVIGESTGLRLNHGGRGRAEIHLETIGQPAHSSSPQLGINAVHLMREVIAAVESIPPRSDPLLGQGIMALTDIISDPYPGYSVIPSRCRVTYDRRLLPGESQAGVLEAITSQPALAAINLKVRIAEGEHLSYTGQTLRATKFFPGWVLPTDHPFVHKSLAALTQAGQSPELGAYQFCTNAAYSAGIAGIPTIGYGPGRESDAHVVDERLRIDELFAVAQGYQGIIQAVLAPA